MEIIWAKHARIAGAWEHDVRVEVSEGRITTLNTNAAPDGTQVSLLIPAPANSHSHAFQRALAGLTERRGPADRDSFWTWRKLMYRFLTQITPDQAEAIAAFVQMEMLEAGFGASVEFHYLHHGPGGVPYDNPAEMSARIAAATKLSGIGLTLLPVLYQYGGCDGRALGVGQDRFGNTPDSFADLLDKAGEACATLSEDTVLGVAPHSLRAVSQDMLRQMGAMRPGAPVHMHLAEQQAEVDEVQAVWGARPVDWALAELPLDARWCLIHCTQMTPGETLGLARSGAVAGLCPLTEASLGDGIFDGVRWMAEAGAISIGSDSNIRISLAEELRQLETSQRLRDHSRAAMATANRSTGLRLLEDAARGGAQAAGRGAGEIAVGAWADLLALDTSHIDLEGLGPETALDSFVFTGDSSMVAEVWSAGRHLVTAGRHVARDTIQERYRKAVKDLRAGI